MRRLLPLVLLAGLLGAPPAVAQDCVAPPGTAAVDEYCETVPGATGDRGQPAPPRRVTPATLEALRASGPEGVKLADQLDREVLARDPNRRADRDEPAPAGRGGDAAAGEPGSNPLAAIRDAVDSGASIEDGLGWVLALVALGLGAAWWVGVRGRRT